MKYIYITFHTTLISIVCQAQIIVQINENFNEQNIFNTYQIRSKKQLSIPLNIWLLEFMNFDIEQQNILQLIKKDLTIINYQLNQELELRSVPNDSLKKEQWQYNNTGKNEGIVDADIDAIEAWSFTTGGKTVNSEEIVVAIIDGGINLNHPDLMENIWTNTNPQKKCVLL